MSTSPRMVLIFQHANVSFAPLAVGAYLSCFDVVRPLEKMPVDRGLPTALRMRFCSGHLFPPFGASSDVLKGCLVVQGATR